MTAVEAVCERMRVCLSLRDKTERKFVEFFEKTARRYEGDAFEVAYSDIQRETGSANVTTKRALQALVEGGVLEHQAGRNSRYGRFRYLPYKPSTQTPPAASTGETQRTQEITQAEGWDDFKLEVQELGLLTNQLLRRVRHQEMAMALLQDRMAELEDKLYKR